MTPLAYENIDLTERDYIVGPIDLSGLDDPTVFSFEFERSGAIAVTSSVAWSFEVSNNHRTWTALTGAVSGKTNVGIEQRIELPPVRYLRARLSTPDSSSSRGDVYIVLRRDAYQSS